MNQVLNTNILLARMEHAMDTHQRGTTPGDELLGVLKWFMAAADGDTVMAFLAAARRNKHLDPGLVDEVASIYRENVQHWVFPEEALYEDLFPDAGGCTFPELILAGLDASAHLDQVLDMLVTLRVPLNMRGTYGALERALKQVNRELESLALACEYVATDAPLASSFPGEEEEGRVPWSSPFGAPLSPRQIVWLADLARRNPENSIPYAEGISSQTATPQLVAELIAERSGDAAKRRVWAEKHGEAEERTRKAMEQVCPRCGSGPGEMCRSKAGNETSMHKGRQSAVSSTTAESTGT